MKKEKIFWGVFFVLAAIFLVLSPMGYFPEIGIFSFIFTIFLVAIMIKGIAHLSFPGILFPLAFLYMIYGELFWKEMISPWTALGAALLGSIGLSMLFPHRKRKNYQMQHDKGVSGEHFESVVNEEDGQRIQHSCKFSSSIKYVNSDDFQYGVFDTSFGAMKIYFDNAIIQKGSATVEMNASFAGIELYLPKSWHVVNQLHTSFGGVEEKNKSDTDGGPVVTLVGDINFAGVTILYV